MDIFGMESTNANSTSKVIIQCTDPSNLFGTFEGRFASHNPLRNLHWKSPTRPLRSIPSLNVELIQETRATNGTQVGARRHQIPGLRETPYVKVYLLRCDNKEIYKEEVRKQIKQWVKENSDIKEAKALRKQEQHDAFEWMIVHVVLPDTPAAAQPRSSKHISVEATESTDSLNSKSKWTGKSPSTIFDKLKADFASSSKSHGNRVFQIRVTEPGKPQGALSPTEQEEQWHEFTEGLKFSILRSFDVRVRQYEDDIQEREIQRTLPGWNFCTFFILKEGLAIGFENVGLLHDALAVYDELELGLDAVVKQQALDEDLDANNALLPYSNHLKKLIRNAIDSSSTNASEIHEPNSQPNIQEMMDHERSRFPFELEKRHYRDLILSNQASALDFRVYLFTVKTDILLRQAQTNSSVRAIAKPTPVDVHVVAQIAEDAVRFINQASRELRIDLYHAWGGRLSGEEFYTQESIIASTVLGWVWAATMQILSFALSALEANLVQTNQLTILDDLLQQREGSAKLLLLQANASSSHNSESRASSPRKRSRSISPQKKPILTSGVHASTDGDVQPEIQLRITSLAFWTAKLLLLARSQLENTQLVDRRSSEPSRNGYSSAKNGVSRNLSASSGTAAEAGNMDESNILGMKSQEEVMSLESKTLREALMSQSETYRIFTLLSALAYRLFQLADSQKAAQQVLSEMTKVAYQSQDYQNATSYVVGVLQGFPQQQLSVHVNAAMLKIYADCLNRSGNSEDYCQCLIACLRHIPDLEQHVAQHYQHELGLAARSVDKATLSSGALIQIFNVDQAISHYHDQDGFRISMTVRSKFPAALKTTAPMRLCLRATTSENPQYIWLNTEHAPHIDAAGTEIEFCGRDNVQGWFELERVELEIGNLVFRHLWQNPKSVDVGTHPDLLPSLVVIPRFMLYPRANALSISIKASRHVILDESRKLTVFVNAGDNNVERCSIRMRAATAGLRLHIHEARMLTALSQDLVIARNEGQAVLEINGMDRHVSAEIIIPYTVEHQSEPAICIKSEIRYETKRGLFTSDVTHIVEIILPISVKVQDSYRDGYLLSKFTITTSTLVPIRLLQCELENGKDLEIQTYHSISPPEIIFPRQPATWIARIPRRKAKEGTTIPPLALKISFQCFNDLILQALTKAFSGDTDDMQDQDALCLLKAHLDARIRNMWTEQDLELAALTQEITVWDAKEMDWESSLVAFDVDRRKAMWQWLQHWHRISATIALTNDAVQPRSLRLLVEQPQWPPIIWVDLSFGLDPSHATLKRGETVAADLVIKVQFEGDNSILERPHDILLAYELVASTDAWLVGGNKKGAVSPSRTSTQIKVILSPQKPGRLLLPMIDIKCRHKDSKIASGWTDVPIEICNKALSRSIGVIENLKSTTVELGIEEHTGMGVALNTGIRVWSSSAKETIS